MEDPYEKNLLARGILLLCTVAFVVLMMAVYFCVENEGLAFGVIFGSTAIFVPNMWALTMVICKKK